MKNFNLTTPHSILIGAALISLTILYSNGAINLKGFQSTTGTPNTQGATPAPVEVSVGNLPVKGDKNAKVTVIEFADYQCPFCGAVTGLNSNNPVFAQLKAQDPTWEPYEPGIFKDYVEKGLVKFAYRDFAFLGVESNDAANAARCANDQGKFWEYHDKLFFSQSGENQGAFTKDKLKAFGAQVGLNTATFNECVDSGKHLSAVTADSNEGRAAGVNGTPALFVNGKLISGAVGYAAVKQAIEEALKN